MRHKRVPSAEHDGNHRGASRPVAFASKLNGSSARAWLDGGVAVPLVDATIIFEYAAARYITAITDVQPVARMVANEGLDDRLCFEHI